MTITILFVLYYPKGQEAGEEEKEEEYLLSPSQNKC